MKKKIYTLVIVNESMHIEGISSWPTLEAAQKELKEDYERTIKDIIGEDEDDEIIDVQELHEKSYYISYCGQYELYAEIREYDMELYPEE